MGEPHQLDVMDKQEQREQPQRVRGRNSQTPKLEQEIKVGRHRYPAHSVIT